jgi:hypothetical protein
MLIFAVHPIHTEVVNSLKNRDELLALFFALLSFSILIKQSFNEKKYLWFLFFCIFLICSVLSKKSSIPIFFCAPLLFVNNDKIQTLHYFTFSIILNFLVAIFGSDFNTVLSVKLFLIGGVFSISFFVIKNQTIWLKIISESFLIKNSYSLLLIISFLLLFIFSIFYKSHEVLIVAYIVLAIFVFLEKSKKELISFFVVFSLFISGIVFKTNDLSDTSSMLSVFLLFEYFNKSKGQRTDYFYLVWLIPLFFNANGFVGVFQFVGFIIQYFLLALVIKYQNLKFVLLLAVGMFFLLFQEIELDYLLFLILLFFNESKFLEKINTSYFHLIFLVVISFLSLNQKENGEVNQVFRIKTKSISKIESKYSEGRELNFVENPLVNINDYQKKLIVGFETTGQYIKLLTLPYPLKFYYGYDVVDTDSKITVFSIAGFIFFCAFIFLIFFFAKKRNNRIMFFIFSSILSLAFFSNWFVLVAGIIGERLVFEASFSIIFVFVYLYYKLDFFSDLFKKITFLIVIILFSILTFVRNQEWKNPLTLMGNDIKHLQNSAQANNLYALNLMNNSKDIKSRKLAIEHFKKAIQIYPNFFNVHYDLGYNYLAIGDTLNSIKHFNKVIELDGSFQDSYLNLVQIYNSKRDWINYLIIAKKLFKIHDHPDSYIILAKGYLENKDINQSKKILKIGISKFPLNNALSMCLNDLGTKSLTITK